MAELVIADAPYKAYPGGVIAIKCDEWIAAGSSASSGSDSLSCTGTYVEDGQTVTTSLRDDLWGAYDEAVDTLEIPLVDLPVHDGWDYMVLVSYRVDGEFDHDNIDTLIHSSDKKFQDVVCIGFHGAGFFSQTEADAQLVNDVLARVPHYATTQISTMDFIDKAADVLYVRAFVQDGCAAVVRLDQITLMPMYVPAPGIVADYQMPFQDPDDLPDGDDGGDDNGQFTWLNETTEPQDFGGGRCDFQQKGDGDDAEYLMRVDAEAEILDVPNVTSHAYALHGVRYREAGDVVNDDFSDRSITVGFGGQHWGITPEGYSWSLSGLAGGTTPRQVAGVTGGEGVQKLNAGTGFGGINSGDIASLLGVPLALGNGAGAAVRVWEQFDFSGKVRFDATTGYDADPGALSSAIIYLLIGFHGGNLQWRLKFNVVNSDDASFAGTWSWYETQNPSSPYATGSIGGFGPGSTIGWRMERKRYVQRLKVWDASGAEPGTWDYEDFRPLDTGPTVEAYPYGPDASDADFNGYAPTQYFEVRTVWNLISKTSLTSWDDIVVRYDPYGDTPTDGHVRVERPEGSTYGEITIPYGAGYIVYWGTDDWTDTVAGNEYPKFSVRAWNEEGAPEMQRIETPWFWFLGIAGGIVSMNWSSGTARDVTRVHAS